MTEESMFAEALEKKTPSDRTAYLDHACAGDVVLRQRMETLLKSHDVEDSFLGKPAIQCAAEEQAAYLDQVCQGDATLRSRLEESLHAHRKAGSFVQEPSAMRASTIDLPPTAERPGTVIGPYKLLQQIGEGGMGTVWMAEQTRPVQRKVALKVIKPGMDSRQVIARFEAERQALAMMDHVNIARVFDGGATPPSPPSQGGTKSAPPLAKGGRGGVAAPTSSWSSSTACRSPSTATTTI